MRRRKYYKEDEDPLWDLFELITTFYFLYLIYLFFLDRNNFWRWVIYGIIAIGLVIGVLLVVDKFIGKKDRGTYLPYQRYFKKKPTPEALKLGNLLKDMGWRVEFEKWDGHKSIDIAITEAKFNIEVEGSQHNLNPNQAFRDQMRDYYSEQKGFVTKRIPNSLLRDNVRAEETARFLDKQLRERVMQLRK
jgi:very-short-patch-repair endonuclease